ncbi:uncharacterized protein LOC119068755 isoform X2 [Bradysia coprophila]|uniref:uncharacterized protein LOC119068755 isoform X2 n=1 Tax=Bradysia coprophila TaxID=38358 RepID=UPI00187DBCC9|nr:uncharacterized protein LOC119068755 isoform X2 [Bradysia coprophila]
MEESPIPPRMRRRSCYSLCQSDYETAAEDSDGSLYYSMFEDEEKENDSADKENHQMTPRNGLSSRKTLLEQCLQKNLNHTPRNEFNKRISCNVIPILSSSPTMTFHGEVGLQEPVFETENEVTKRSKDEDASGMPTSSSSTETLNDANVSVSTEVGEEDLNRTIIGVATNATKDDPIGEAQVGAVAVTSTTTAFINLKTTGIPCGPKRFGPASSNQNVGLSNLPVPKKISIADLANPPAATTTRNSHIPSSKRMSLFCGHSTEHYGYSKPNGKSGIPKVSLMLARNNSVLPSSSTQCVCEYCDKKFAKKSILDVHLLDKCEKIPPARRRQLSRQQTYPNQIPH